MSITFDAALLRELGLGALAEPDQRSLLRAMQEELALRVGTVICSAMTPAQLDEYSGFEQPGTEFALRWLDAHRPHWRSEAGDLDDAAITQWATALWLELNVPGFQDLAHPTFELLKRSVALRAPAVLRALVRQDPA